jgi:hypothetical protein
MGRGQGHGWAWHVCAGVGLEGGVDMIRLLTFASQFRRGRLGKWVTGAGQTRIRVCNHEKISNVALSYLAGASLDYW